MENYFIFGFASSGESVFNLIIKKCKYKTIYIYDELPQIREKAWKITKNVPNIYVLNQLNVEVLKDVTTVILSPGVSIYNNWVKYLKTKKVQVISELEFGYRFFKKNLIAITGTNGKTTCVKLLNTILNKSKKKSVAVGNMGYPISRAVLENKKAKFFVCEVSSFQLEATDKFKPKIACVLNITSDHINRHKTFLNYKKIKLKIAKNLTKKDYFVCNTNLNIKLNNCKNYCFGRDNLKFGSFCKNGDIYFRNLKGEEKICKETDVLLVGEHNMENVLAVITICKILKIKNKYILYGLKDFKLDAHRLQNVFSKNNIDFVDDSKATNVDATLKAIDCFKKENLILLLGGSDKGFDFEDIFKKSTQIKKVVCFGEVRDKLEKCAKKYNVNSESFKSLKEATNYACKNSNSGDTVLLSPANASFDEFSSYKDRGNKFLEYIKNFFES